MPSEKENEQGLDASTTDLVEEASALKEMSDKVKNLEAQNAELMAAKKKYYDTILNGQTVEENAQDRTSEEIRKEMASLDKQSVTNLDYGKLALELDDAVRKETGESCFLPKGKDITPTADEIVTADKMHDALKDSVEGAEGDPEKFNYLFGSHIRKKL